MKTIAYALMWLANKLITKKRDVSWQKKQEIECVKNGHLWTKFDNNNDMTNPIKNRVYCRRCGQMYHEHNYINTVDLTN